MSGKYFTHHSVQIFKILFRWFCSQKTCSRDFSSESGPLHRIEFGPPKFSSKTFRLSMISYSTLQIFGRVHFRKACRSCKKDWNSRKSCASSRNLLEPFLRSRKEENLYGHCAINKARRILSKGSTLLLFLVEKASFSKEFRSEF